MPVLDFLRAKAWMLCCIGLSILVAVKSFEVRHLEKVVDQDAKQIRVLTRDLTQSRTNADNLQVALDKQNASLLDVQAKSQARIAAAETALTAAQRNTATAQQRAGAIMSHKPQGTTDAERMLDVDRKFAESLK